MRIDLILFRIQAKRKEHNKCKKKSKEKNMSLFEWAFGKTLTPQERLKKVCGTTSYNIRTFSTSSAEQYPALFFFSIFPSYLFSFLLTISYDGF